MNRAVVYLLNNEKKYIRMAMNSISMLRSFNKNIKIICLSNFPIFFDESLDVENIVFLDLDNKYFLLNKSQIANLEYDSILYIDSDTFIFDDVEKIFNFYKEDFCGCENKWSYNLNFDQFKPINGGVLLFNNYSYKKIYENFAEKLNNLDRYYPKIDKWIKKINNNWVKEEFLTSAVANDQKFSINFFDQKYVKIIENLKDIDKIKDSIIFHSFANNWDLIKRTINKNNVKIFKYKKLN